MADRKTARVAHIVPPSHYKDIINNEYHMCLAHLVGNGKNAYTDFYRGLADADKFVLMDNGAAEGNQLPADTLVEMYKMICPSEIVLPDTLNNGIDTIMKTKMFLDMYGEELADEGITFMGVPQGKTLQEWQACATLMLSDERIHSIGVSKFLNITTGNPMVRYDAVNHIDVVSYEMGRDVEVHLLGCDEGPGIVGKIVKQFSIVRGCDTAFCYIAAQAGIGGITEDTKRPDGEIDFLNGPHYTMFPYLAAEFDRVVGVKNNTQQWKKGW